MKRTIGILAGIATVGIVAYLGSGLWAQTTPPATGTAPAATVQPPRTRIALLNLSQVIKSYKKWENFQNEFKTDYQRYETQVKNMKTEADKLQAEGTNPTTAQARREQCERDIKRIQREMQDKSEEAKKYLGDKETNQLTIIYKEVEAMAQYYARAKEIELVLHYNDPFAPADPYNATNIQRKLTTGACMPLYSHPGMDITADVGNLLNASYTRAMGGGGTQSPR